MSTINLIQLNGGFGFYLEFNTETRSFKKRFSIKMPVAKGWYEFVNGKFISVFRVNSELRLLLKGQELNLSDRISSDWVTIGKYAEFFLKLDEKVLYSHKYKRKAFNWLNRNYFTYVESHEDFFLSLHELISHPMEWYDYFVFSESEKL